MGVTLHNGNSLCAGFKIKSGLILNMTKNRPEDHPSRKKQATTRATLALKVIENNSDGKTYPVKSLSTIYDFN